jgi:DNA-binding SARP family transcriptional activator
MLVYRPDGSAVKGLLWGRAKVRALLALLTLAKDHLLHRDQIIAALWPNMSRTAALKNLNTTVYGLRLCLEPDLEDGSNSCYLSNLGRGYYCLKGDIPILADTKIFETCAREIRAASETDRAACLCQRAITLYRGDLLADLVPLPYIFDPERIRLRTLYFETMEQLASFYEGRGQEDEATEIYLKLLEMDPARVSAAVQLVRLTLRRGDFLATRSYQNRLRLAIAEKRRLLAGSETQSFVEQTNVVPLLKMD